MRSLDADDYDNSKGPLIYFIQVGADGPIRIGSTLNLKSYFRQVKSCNPCEVYLRGAMPGWYKDSARICDSFVLSKLRQDWFLPDAELLAFIAALDVPEPVRRLCDPLSCPFCAGQSPEQLALPNKAARPSRRSVNVTAGQASESSALGAVDTDQELAIVVSRDNPESRLSEQHGDALKLHRRRMGENDVPGMLARDAPDEWTDTEGIQWRTPRHRESLGGSHPTHVALRVHVLARDSHRCCWCKTKHSLVVDHIIARAAGGAQHPSNLRVLCVSCNSYKAGKVDVPAAARYQAYGDAP